MERIEGRTAFVTGAASGIGLGIAESLVAAGARVALADWDFAGVQSAAARLGDTTLSVTLDVRDRPGWEHARRATEDKFGEVDILVNNAGIGPDLTELADTSPEKFDQLVAIKLTGTFNGIHTFGAGMRARGEGHIVNTASMAGLIASAKLGPYTASKFAVVGLTEVLRAEMEAYGVGVSVLCPGLVRTNLGSHSRQPGQADGSQSGTAASGQAGTAESGQSGTEESGPMAGIDPSVVGEQVLAAIRANDLYIVTHGEYGSVVAARADRLRRAFEAAPQRGSAEGLPGTDVART